MYMRVLTVISVMLFLCFGLQAQKKAKHTAIDLGLSVKWATCNVGANAPEEFGGYYAWGETVEKETYTWRSYKHCAGSSTRLTKYCVGYTYGQADNLEEMEAADDVATQRWGRQWRMPTDAEMTELREKCTWRWTTLNGVSGYEVKGRNGQSIFLPAAGSRQDDVLIYEGSQGYYNTRTTCRDYSFSVYGICFVEGEVQRVDFSRRFGVSVRPVCK